MFPPPMKRAGQSTSQDARLSICHGDDPDDVRSGQSRDRYDVHTDVFLEAEIRGAADISMRTWEVDCARPQSSVRIRIPALAAHRV